MRRQILRRLEALERAAETEVFANALPYAIAYDLDGAKHVSDGQQAYARALGYAQWGDRLDRRLGTRSPSASPTFREDRFRARHKPGSRG
jgi:hypothetical protein